MHNKRAREASIGRRVLAAYSQSMISPTICAPVRVRVVATLVLASLLAGCAAPRAHAAGVPADAAAGAPVLAAMQEELERSMGRLVMQGYDAPYFIAYQLKEHEKVEIEGRFGAVFGESRQRERRLYVEVRVGSHDSDNLSGSPEDAATYREGYFADADAPLEDDPAALRNALWLLTDERYKEALAAWLKLRGAGVYKVEEEGERTAALSREEPVVSVGPDRALAVDATAWRGLARRLSAAFARHPAIFDSSVRLSAERVRRVFISSEGTRVTDTRVLYGVYVQAVARAADGMLLDHDRSFYARDATRLPPADVLEREIHALAAELEALREAPVLDPYTGPALLEPTATGVLFHETIGHRLEGERLADDREGRTFKGRVGELVAPPFISVIDDPTLASHGGDDLNGHYAHDDEGIAARRVPLIEDGVLRNFLLSRRPVKGFSQSNGHGRAAGAQKPMARMGVLVIASGKRVPHAELVRMVVAQARRQGKPYGLVLRDIQGGSTNTSTYGYQAFKGSARLVYKVDARTGAETLVRGVELVGTPLTVVNKIIATSEELGVFNGFCGAESGYIPVSTVAPAALLEEIELQRTQQQNEKAPLLPSPWTGAPPG
jgi:predicted Zn-dependent protease